jgi:hypothetical protein
MKPKKIRKLWELFRPDTLFKDFNGANDSEVQDFLCAISAVQNGDEHYIRTDKPANEFLGKVFPKLINPLVPDIKILQQELSVYVSPPNPPALERTEESHYIPLPTSARAREAVIYAAEDLDFEDPGTHFLAQGL